MDKGYSVTKRAQKIKQPYGGYVPIKDFEQISLKDGKKLAPEENIHGAIVGLAVDYLSRFMIGDKDAFNVSLMGAEIATINGFKEATNIADKLYGRIKGLNYESIKSTCKLVTFDTWYRNPIGAIYAKNYAETKPNRDTIDNIRIMVERTLAFFEMYGPIIKSGFTFEPPDTSESDIEKPGISSMLAEKLAADIYALAEYYKEFVVVTNDIFEDSIVYDEVTRGYIRELGELNRLLAEEAGSVTEVVCGIPLTIK